MGWNAECEEGEWLVGERVESVGLLGRDPMTILKADPMSRRLILAAVTALGVRHAVELCVGPPLHQFNRQGQTMRHLLTGRHQVSVGAEESAVRLLGVIVPDASGLWVWSLISQNGNPSDLGWIRQPTVILDFGQDASPDRVSPACGSPSGRTCWPTVLPKAGRAPRRRCSRAPERRCPGPRSGWE